MASTIKIKRSSVAGKVPLTTDLTTGEIAINTKDKKLYSSNGTAVFEIGSQLNNLTVTGNTSVAGLIANGSLGTSGKVLKTNGTTVYWGTDLSTAGSGFSNGQSISVTNLVVTANATISKLIANGSLGTAGYVLKSNGSTVYWSADVADVGGATNIGVNANTQSFTGTGSTSAFTLNRNLVSQDAIVSINGLIQKPTTHYSISGSTLTFTSPPANGDSIEVRNFVGSMGANVAGWFGVYGRQSISTNLFVGGNTTLSGTLVANNSAGTAGYYLRTSGTGVYWSPVAASGATWSALLSTNTALRTLISDRLQVANAVSTYATKSNPTTSGLLAHTGRATISTNLAVSGNTTLSGTLVANSSAGTAGHYLRSSGTGVYWSPVSSGGGGVTTGKAVAMALIFN